MVQDKKVSVYKSIAAISGLDETERETYGSKFKIIIWLLYFLMKMIK